MPPLVLVADDNDVVRGSVAALLGRAGCQVAVAANGTEALRLAEAIEPNLLVLDIDMPGLSGLEVARRVRRSETLGQTPIVVISSFGDKRDIEAGLAAGADTYLIKPFRIEDLLDSIGALLRHSG